MAAALIPCPADGCGAGMTHAELRKLLGAAGVRAACTCVDIARVADELHTKKRAHVACVRPGFQTLDRRALEAVVVADPTLHMCPTPDCPNIVAWTGPEDGPPAIDCAVCKRRSCVICGAYPFHEGSNCPPPRAAAAAGGGGDGASAGGGGGHAVRALCGDERSPNYSSRVIVLLPCAAPM